MYLATKWTKFIKNLKLSYPFNQKWREEGWIDRQVNKGRLSKVHANKIKMIIPILDSIHPGNWDLQFHISLRWQKEKNMYRPVYFSERKHNRFIERYGGYGENSEQIFEDWLWGSQILKEARYASYHDVYEDYVESEFTYAKKLFHESASIIVRYPELTIKNSRQQSLQIKDLFIKLTFDIEGDLNIGLDGTRTTYTLEEFASDYTHSHLPKKKLHTFEENRMRYEAFCLGTGEIKDFISMFNAEPTVGNFESVIYMMNTVASWESLEGTPYAALEHTLAKHLNVPNVSLDDCQFIFNEILVMARKLKSFDIDWVYKDNKYVIVENEKFEEFLRLAYYRYAKSDIPESAIAYIDETGTYYVPSGVSQMAAEVHPTDFIPFQGQKVMLKVEGELKFSGERRWYINPKIKQYVKSKLECSLSKTQIRNDTIERLNQVSNNGRVLEPS